jgi:hypothetical protein
MNVTANLLLQEASYNEPISLIQLKTKLNKHYTKFKTACVIAYTALSW